MAVHLPLSRLRSRTPPWQDAEPTLLRQLVRIGAKDETLPHCLRILTPGMKSHTGGLVRASSYKKPVHTACRTRSEPFRWTLDDMIDGTFRVQPSGRMRHYQALTAAFFNRFS